MAKARVFRPDKSQAGRRAKPFRLTSKEVAIDGRRDEMIPRENPRSLARAFDLLSYLPDVERDDAPPPEREGL